MSFNQKELKDEKKNRRKGIFYSVTLHSLLLLLAILPFLDPPADIDKNFAIVVEFEKPIVRSGSQSKASAASSSSDAAANQGQDEPKPQRNVQEVKRLNNTEVKPTTSPVEEVITAPDITAPKFPEPVESPQRLETRTPNTTPASQSETDASIDDFLPVLDKIIEEEQTANGSGALGDSEVDPNASGGGGDGGAGSGKEDNDGQASGSGTGDNRLPPGAYGDGGTSGIGDAGFDGEGPLRRRVKIRPDCAHLAYTDAKIVLDLCINRAGDVTYSKYNLRMSSIKDRKYARDITNCFRDIVFESDFTAPSKECGTYSYKFIHEGSHEEK
ncbi:MAG: hypothetical protein R3275_00940 [Saprospiraceae bacterium]|nr:hypothetical protein [Saprospiraceae bacterium]